MDHHGRVHAGGKTVSDRARADLRLAWLIVGACACVTLMLVGLAIGWAGGTVMRWAEMQGRQARDARPVFVDPDAAMPEARTDPDTPQPIAEGPPPPNTARPVGSPAQWIGPKDYPPTALRKGYVGRVRVTVAVDRVGNPTGCAVRQSSGHWTLDNATCAAMLNRGQFDAARRGPRVRHWTSPVIRWALPS